MTTPNPPLKSLATPANQAGMKCQICRTPQTEDVCPACKLTYVGGLPTTTARIALVREMLGLKDEEFVRHDRGQGARRILDRRY